MSNANSIPRAMSGRVDQPLYGNTPTNYSIKRRQRLADALRESATDSSPVGHWSQAAARVLNGFVGGMQERRAEKEADQRRQALADSLGGDASPSELRRAGILYEAPELLSVAGDMQGQSNADRAFNYQQGRDARQDARWQQGFNAEQTRDDRNYGLEREKFDWQKNAPPDPTGDMREYEYSLQNPGFADYQTNLKRAGATNVNTTVGGSNETELGKKLSGKEGEAWSGYLDSANVSGGTLQDLDALDELLKVAPQGPIAGRLAEAFPGFSSAGDAVQSIVMRIAPTLRTPGSGSTSDIEYEGMLKSIPRLRNSPQGNAMISGVMRAKQQVNVERGQIVSAYQNRQIDEQTARAKLQELNARSILSPELKAMLGGEEAPQDQGYGLNDLEQEMRRRGLAQ